MARRAFIKNLGFEKLGGRTLERWEKLGLEEVQSCLQAWRSESKAWLLR
jgi:hypothetical protein